jgi:hypothetical protein
MKSFDGSFGVLGDAIHILAQAKTGENGRVFEKPKNMGHESVSHRTSAAKATCESTDSRFLKRRPIQTKHDINT